MHKSVNGILHGYDGNGGKRECEIGEALNPFRHRPTKSFVEFCAILPCWVLVLVLVSCERARLGIINVAVTLAHPSQLLRIRSFCRNSPLVPCKPVGDSLRRRLKGAMSKLLRPSQKSSYHPLPQNSRTDDDENPEKETESLQSRAKPYLCSHWLQLAIIVVLLLLTGIAGFIVGLAFPESRLSFSSFSDTVPQGALSSRVPCTPLADWLSSSCHWLVQGDISVR